MKAWVYAAALALALLPLAVVQPVQVQGHSMEPAFRNGDRAWALRAWAAGAPRRGQVWLVEGPEGPVLKRVGAALDPRRYNGACMVGLRGVVVKRHGSADRTAFARAIALARNAAIHDIPGCVARALGPNGSLQGS